LSDTDLIYLLTRILSCGIWIAAALYKATHYELTIHEMREQRIPWARLILPPVIVLELAGALLLIINWWVWAVALAWLIFLLPASWIYHGRYMVRSGTIDFPQWISFWKNVSIAGGLLALILLDASRPTWLFA
jgi:putative oxidoreductase